MIKVSPPPKLDVNRFVVALQAIAESLNKFGESVAPAIERLREANRELEKERHDRKE